MRRKLRAMTEPKYWRTWDEVRHVWDTPVDGQAWMADIRSLDEMVDPYVGEDPWERAERRVGERAEHRGQDAGQATRPTLAADAERTGNEAGMTREDWMFFTFDPPQEHLALFRYAPGLTPEKWTPDGWLQHPAVMRHLLTPTEITEQSADRAGQLFPDADLDAPPAAG